MLCPLCDGVDPTPQILMACIAKFVPSILVSKIVTRKSWGFCASLGILMNTRGLVELIVLNIGLDAKILSIKMCVCSPIPCVPSCPSAAVAGPTPSHLPAITLLLGSFLHLSLRYTRVHVRGRHAIAVMSLIRLLARPVAPNVCTTPSHARCCGAGTP